jgi:peptidoglycan hydrolase CwlO-like protein
MKKKIINGIMMVALVVATSTSFVSCKDTNEDVRIEQDAKINALQNELDVLEGKYGDLDGRVSALRTDVDALAASMTQAETQLAEFDGKIANLEKNRDKEYNTSFLFHSILDAADIQYSYLNDDEDIFK